MGKPKIVEGARVMDQTGRIGVVTSVYIKSPEETDILTRLATDIDFGNEVVVGVSLREATTWWWNQINFTSYGMIPNPPKQEFIMTEEEFLIRQQYETLIIQDWESRGRTVQKFQWRTLRTCTLWIERPTPTYYQYRRSGIPNELNKKFFDAWKQEIADWQQEVETCASRKMEFYSCYPAYHHVHLTVKYPYIVREFLWENF